MVSGYLCITFNCVVYVYIFIVCKVLMVAKVGGISGVFFMCVVGENKVKAHLAIFCHMKGLDG